MKNDAVKIQQPPSAAPQGVRGVIAHEAYKDACARYGCPLIDAEAVIDSYLQSLRPVPQPKLVHTLGVPGSGKSTYARTQQLTNTLLLNFDDVMEKMPAYQRDKAEKGNRIAYEAWMDCAREIGYEILFRAFEQHMDVFFDHSGARADHVALIQTVRDAGYKIEIAMFDIDPELAVKRVGGRDRHVPLHFVAERQKIIAGLLPQYQALADKYAEYRATADGNVVVTG